MCVGFFLDSMYASFGLRCCCLDFKWKYSRTCSWHSIINTCWSIFQVWTRLVHVRDKLIRVQCSISFKEEQHKFVWHRGWAKVHTCQFYERTIQLTVSLKPLHSFHPHPSSFPLHMLQLCAIDNFIWNTCILVTEVGDKTATIQNPSIWSHAETHT